MVKVYTFRTWDAISDGWIIQPRKSSAERIERCRGQIIDRTVEDVPEDALDAEGRYSPDA